jgi:hypothetical protein
MLLSHRRSKEIPGKDSMGRPNDPVRFIEDVVIPRSKELDPYLKISPEISTCLMPRAGLCQRLWRAGYDYSLKDEWNETIRLYVDTQRAILRIPHPVLRAGYCESVKQNLVKANFDHRARLAHKAYRKANDTGIQPLKP